MAPRATRARTPHKETPAVAQSAAELKLLGHTEYIPVGELRVDARYQRTDEIDWAEVRQITENLDPLRLETLTIARRADGSNWIMDGQHRWLGARERDPSFLMPSRVHQSQGVEWEANIYNLLNTHRKNPSASGKFKSALVAGRKYGFDNEVELQALLDELGVSYAPNANLRHGHGMEKRAPAVAAIGSLLRQHANAPELVREELIALRDAWGEDHPNAYGVPLLAGINAFLAAHMGENGYSTEALVTRLKMTSPGRVIEDATVLRGTRQYAVGACVARVIAENYNRGRSGIHRVREIPPSQYAFAVAGYLLKKRNAALPAAERARMNANLKVGAVRVSNRLGKKLGPRAVAAKW